MLVGGRNPPTFVRPLPWGTAGLPSVASRAPSLFVRRKERMTMNAIPARFSGQCLPCGEAINQGEYILNHPTVGWIHEDCTDIADEAPQMTAEPRIRAGHTPDVMPRGKTARDRCDRCFLVHTAHQGDSCE